MQRSVQAKDEVKQTNPNVKLVPPDGGYGWVIVAAFAITHFFDVPMFSMFGFVFGDKFKRIGITATDISVIQNINAAVGLGFGMMNGPLLRRFTYRQLSMVGSILLFSGTLLTALAESMAFYIFSFGIVFALGFSTTNQPQQIAMHSYFLRLRGRAMSFGVTACGFGPVFIPLLVGYLLEWYTEEGTMLILSALVLHSLPASALLHPVRWHMKVVPADPEVADPKIIDPESDEEEDAVISSVIPAVPCRKRTITMTSADLDCHSLYALELPLMQEQRRNSNLSMPPIVSSPSRPIYRHSVSQQAPTRPGFQWWSSEDTMGSTPQVFENIHLSDSPIPTPVMDGATHSKANTASNEAVQVEQDINQSLFSSFKSRMRSWGLAVVDFFDLRLLLEPGYFIIVLGMSVALFSEINFSNLFPIILNDMNNFNVHQVAWLLSVMGATDIAARFIVPYIAEFLSVPHKTMYLVSLVMLVIVRSIMMIFTGYVAMLVLTGAFGIARGVRAVFMPLVIPSHVPLERLPAAMGLQMVFNAILFLSFGPLVGLLRDTSGSYMLVFVLVNVLTLFTVVLWTWRACFMWTRGYCTVSDSDQELCSPHG